ncbi:MAG: glycosyltransferase family 4 protein [Flavobacteriales bacterium]
MKIGFLSSSTGWGGLERNLLRHARWMEELGHETCVFCVQDSKLWSAANETTRVVIQRHHRYLHWTAGRALHQLLLTHGVDVLWTRDPRDLGICGQAAMRTQIPLIFQQGMQLAGPKLMPWHQQRFRRVSRWVSPLHWLQAQVETWTSVPSENIQVIPLGLEATWWAPPEQIMAARSALGWPLERRLVGCFGRLDPLKGQDVLIRALVHLPTLWEAVFVGDNTVNEDRDMLGELKQLARKLGVKNRVHFYPSMEALRPAYDAVDVLAICSVSETIGMVTLEAMAAGAAVVGTQSGGTPELFLKGEVDGKALFQPGDPRALAQCIESGPFRANRQTLRQHFEETQVKSQWKALLENLPGAHQKP